jgi:hypothetical protein
MRCCSEVPSCVTDGQYIRRTVLDQMRSCSVTGVSPDERQCAGQGPKCEAGLVAKTSVKGYGSISVALLKLGFSTDGSLPVNSKLKVRCNCYARSTNRSRSGSLSEQEASVTTLVQT